MKKWAHIKKRRWKTTFKAHTSWLGCIINSTLFQPWEYKGPPFHDMIWKIDVKMSFEARSCLLSYPIFAKDGSNSLGNIPRKCLLGLISVTYTCRLKYIATDLVFKVCCHRFSLTTGHAVCETWQIGVDHQACSN